MVTVAVEMEGARPHQPDEAEEPACYTELPETLSSEWVKTFSADLAKATWKGQKALKALLPVHLVTQLLSKVAARLTKEPTLIEVRRSHRHSG